MCATVSTRRRPAAKPLQPPPPKQMDVQAMCRRAEALKARLMQPSLMQCLKDLEKANPPLRPDPDHAFESTADADADLNHKAKPIGRTTHKPNVSTP